MGPLQQTEAEVLYTEHRRQMAWINEHDWKLAAPARRSLRLAIAKALFAVARRIAPMPPERERQVDAVGQ